MATSNHSDVKSSLRTLQILKVLSKHPRGLRFSELQRQTNIPKSSLFVLLSTIQNEQWIEFSKLTSKYTLGIQAWESTQHYMNQNKLVLIAESHITEMMTDLHVAGHLAVLSGRDVLYLAQITPDSSYELPSRVGSRLPAQATALGKSLLTGFTDNEIVDLFKDHAFVKYNPHTTNSIKTLLAEVSRVRQSGYAESNGEIVENVYCAAAPIQDDRNKVVAAISSTVTTESISNRKISKSALQEYVKEQASKISDELKLSS